MKRLFYDQKVCFEIEFSHKELFNIFFKLLNAYLQLATGEPALCMSVVAVFALRQAIESARKDAGITEWFELGAPTTPEHVFLHAGNSIEEYKLI